MEAPIQKWENDQAAQRISAQIAGLPEAAEPVVNTDVATVETSPESAPRTLLERRDSAMAVELRLLHSGAVAITVEDENGLHGAIVPPEKARDAFDHPYCYLS